MFFTNSGSESADTALKIALAYHRARGEAGRYRLIGRERGYHGVNFGGMAVGGITANKKMFGPGVAGVDHIRHTHDPARNAFSRGQPKHGVEFADELERLCVLHDPSTIAAVIVEPVAGSAGVLVPPVGYLERLREICTRHGILLIFDEVITGFGRLGKPFGSQHFGVMPDLFTTAKGLTNATVPMGAVFVKDAIFEAFMQGAGRHRDLPRLHLLRATRSPAPRASPRWTPTRKRACSRARRASRSTGRTRAHALKGAPHVVDVRNCGLMAAIELEPRAGQPGKRAYEVFVKAFEAGVLIRVTGDTIALSPPLIVEKSQIDRIFDCVATMLRSVPYRTAAREKGRDRTMNYGGFWIRFLAYLVDSLIVTIGFIAIMMLPGADGPRAGRRRAHLPGARASSTGR